MTRDEIHDRLRRILREDFGVAEDKTGAEASFRGTMGLDSLDVVDLIFFLQKEFKVKAPMEAYRELHTVRKLIDFIETKVAEPASSSA